MSPHVVGCVPYVNAIPLVIAFDEERAPVRVVYDVPSKLPALLEAGEAEAILVSSVDALRVPRRRMVGGVCIGTRGAVKSVRVFSKVAPEQIRTLALDASSMTSNRLAQIVLRETYGVRPEVTTQPPALDPMLEEADACVLIGDIGMVAQGEGLTVLDLGEEWFRLTGLPFVWAAWIGTDRLSAELAEHLRAAMHATSDENSDSQERETLRHRAVARATGHPNWTDAMIWDYFENVMSYRMDDAMLAGLREYQRRLIASGFDDCVHFPRVV